MKGAIVSRGPNRYAISVEQALDLLRRAKTISQAKFVYDRGKAVEALVRAERAGADAVNESREIQLWAARKVGELIADLPKATGAKGVGKSAVPAGNRTPTYADQGLSKKEAALWQKYAATPEDVFAQHIDGIRSRSEKLTSSAIIAAISSQEGYDGDESYTPDGWLALARLVLGGEFDLDPASSDAAHRRVRAARYFTKESSGLEQEWAAERLWLNPPYSSPLISQFIDKLVEELVAGRVKRGIVLVNNSSDTEWFHRLARSSARMCFVSGRINFDQLRPSGEVKATKGNRYAQTFFGVGDVDVARFLEQFGAVGFVAQRAA